MQPVGLSARWEIGPRYLGCLVPAASPGPPNWTCGGSGRSAMAMRRDVAGTSGVNASFRVSCQSGHSSVQEGQAASPVTSVLYLRVSTIDRTTANQERELREVATRMGCDIVKVYKDHGISGAKGREKRPAFDALCRDAAQRKFDLVMAWSVDRLGRSLQDLVAFRATCAAHRSFLAPAGPRPSQASSTFTMSPIRPEAIRHARSHRGSHAKAALWCVGLLCAIYRIRLARLSTDLASCTGSKPSTMRRRRSLSGRWRSGRTRSARTTPMWLRPSTIWPSCIRPKASTAKRRGSRRSL